MARWITDHIAVAGAAISPENWRSFAEGLGISAVINLRAEYQDIFGSSPPAAYLWLPVEEFSDPKLEQLLLGSQFIGAALKNGRRVLIHCRMGIGRAPTMAAAYLVWQGATIDEAVEQVEQNPRRPYGPVVSRTALEKFVRYLQRWEPGIGGAEDVAR